MLFLYNEIKWINASANNKFTDKDVVINNITLKAIQLTPKARYHIKNRVTCNPVQI